MMQRLTLILFAALLQVCICQQQCSVIPNKSERLRQISRRVSAQTTQSFRNLTDVPASLSSLPKRSLPRSLARLRNAAEVANSIARRSFKTSIPFWRNICRYIRRDIIMSSYFIYRPFITEYHCFIPPPFSGYRFFNVYCPCCNTCNISGNPCGWYICLPEIRRRYFIPGLCYRRSGSSWIRPRWMIITIYTFEACCCNRFF